jgi:hypothetical protein
MNPLRIAEHLRTDYLQLLTTTFAPRQERLKQDFRTAVERPAAGPVPVVGSAGRPGLLNHPLNSSPGRREHGSQVWRRDTK